MTFEEAVRQTPDIAGGWKSGLRALSPAHRAHVSAKDPRRLRGSVNVDEALRDKYPDAPRWDYAVGHQQGSGGNEMIYWIEIHPAGEHGITEVLRKRQWLRQWLKESALLLRKMPSDFVWVSSGRTSFTARSPQARRLAEGGVRNVGRRLVIPSNAHRIQS